MIDVDALKAAFDDAKQKYIRMAKEAEERAESAQATARATNRAITQLGKAAEDVVAALRMPSTGTRLEQAVEFSQRLLKLEAELQANGFWLQEEESSES